MGIPPFRGLPRVLHIRLYNLFLERNFSSSFYGLQFLVEKCGIPLKKNSWLAQKICFDEKASSRVKSVITFLKSHDFSEAQIAKLIEKRPRILQCGISKNLNPKIQYLTENGFKGSHLHHIVLGNPHIFDMSLISCIKPAHHFLKTFLGSDESAREAIKRAPYVLTTTNLDKKLKLNIEYLAKQGMPSSTIVRFALFKPMTMILRNERLVYFVEKVRDLGVMPHSPMFLHILHKRAGMKESTWKRKVEMYKSWGWSDEDVVSSFVTKPSCFSISEEKLRRALDFFLNDMGIPREVIIACPVVLLFSFEERTRPRCSVVQILDKEKLLGKWSLSSLLIQSEESFIRNFITKHLNQVPHLLEAYHASKKSSNMS